MVGQERNEVNHESRITGRGGWSVGCRYYNFMLYIALYSTYFSMTFPPSPLYCNDHSANLWLYNFLKMSNKNAIGAFHYVFNIKNFSEYINIVLEKPKLSLTLIICHRIKIVATILPIRKFEIFRTI